MNRFRSIWLLWALGCVAGFGSVGCGGPEEFTDLSGTSAKKYFGPAWPKGVKLEDVESVSFKSSASIDSSSAWYRIKLCKPAASTWAEELHQLEQQGRFNTDKKLEGVKRTISGPPPLHRQTGTTPKWWSPPKIDFRATEVMVWYSDGHSGVGRATYSGFDDSDNTLWIYAYSCQHDLLWEQGKLPEGEPIDFAKNQQKEAK